LPHPFQAKLTINEPGDPYEQEADRVAEQVMRMPEPAIRLQRKCGHASSSCQACTECTDEGVRVQRRVTNTANATDTSAPSIVDDVLRTTGQPLDRSTRSFMEQRFKRDFSDVRLHTDQLGNESAQAVGALAYTVGRHVVFGAGQYSPQTSAGRSLLAHELAHVVQQSRSSQPSSSSETQNGLRLQRQPDTRARGPAGPARSVIRIDVDVVPAILDSSKGIDDITHEFYRIPIDLLPPNTPIPAGPILTIGPYGCGLRRYGLTIDDFSLTYTLNDRDIQSSSRPFGLVAGSNLSTVECWANQVRFRARLRQTILLPNDLARHLCTRDDNAATLRREILAHERLHEGDNVAAANEIRERLRIRLLSTIGIGPLMAMAQITSDRASFVRECSTRIRQRLDQLRGEYDTLYHRLSADAAIIRDPHDTDLHNLKQQLLERARGQPAP
jgi:hypothetical protein